MSLICVKGDGMRFGGYNTRWGKINILYLFLQNNGRDGMRFGGYNTRWGKINILYLFLQNNGRDGMRFGGYNTRWGKINILYLFLQNNGREMEANYIGNVDFMISSRILFLLHYEIMKFNKFFISKSIYSDNIPIGRLHEIAVLTSL